MTPVLGTVDTRGWEHRNPATTLANVQAQTEPGAVILMHDIHPTTVAAVGDVVDWLQANGYTLVTVGDLQDG